MPASATDTPYADLTPDLALDIIESLGQRVDGRLLQLNSYENRVFQVGLEDGGFVVAKFYRPGRWRDEQILEEHAFAQELLEGEVPAVPPLTLTAVDHPRLSTPSHILGPHQTLGCVSGHRVSISPRRGGRAPELEDPDVLSWLGRFLARLHVVGSKHPFAHRLRLDAHTMGRAPRQWLLEQDIIPIEQRANWSAMSDQAIDLAQAAFEGMDDLRYRRLHGDCHPGNVLWTPEGPHFVDLDDACMGPAVQDFWMLLSGESRERQQQLNALLDGYESVAEFDWRELKLIEPLRTLRLIHHSAWLARRWNDPAVPTAFPWFASPSYWQQQTDLLRQQIDLMQNMETDRPMWMD